MSTSPPRISLLRPVLTGAAVGAIAALAVSFLIHTTNTGRKPGLFTTCLEYANLESFTCGPRFDSWTFLLLLFAILGAALGPTVSSACAARADRKAERREEPRSFSDRVAAIFGESDVKPQ